MLSCHSAQALALAWSAFGVSLTAPLMAAQPFDPEALRVFASLTEDQWNDVNRGVPQARVLDTREKREVAVVGVARLQATTACFLSKFQDIETFKKNPVVLRIGKIGLPVDPHSLDGFQIEPRDITDLRNCSVGHCSVKLSSETIERFDRDVARSRPDYTMQAQSVVREESLRYIETYLREGNTALIEYHDKSKPVRLQDEFLGVLDARPGLAEFAPAFRTWLALYPAGALPGVSEFLYWSTESFGLKPVTSITHVFIYALPGQAAIASKQIYASHYFDASVGLTAAWDDASNPAHPAMYLVYLNRSRIDLLSGFFGGLRRAILRGRLRDGMRKNLAEVVRKLESSCANQPDASSNAQ